MITANQIRSKPSSPASGMNIGTVSSIIDNWSMNMPSTSNAANIESRITSGAASAEVAQAIIPALAPENARICENVADIMIIMNAMTVTRSAPRKLLTTASQVRQRKAAARMTTPTTPNAAASVGVATPPRMTPDDQRHHQRHRQHVADDKPDLGAERHRGHVVLRRGVGIEAQLGVDQHAVEAGEQQARQQPGDQQLADVDPRQTGEQDREARRRNDHRQAAGPEDRPDRHRGFVAAPGHFGNQQAAEHRGIRHARARQGGEHGAADHGEIGEPAAHPPQAFVERVEYPHGESGMEKQLAHDEEQRHRYQRERGDRRKGIADELADTDFAAEEQLRTAVTN